MCPFRPDAGARVLRDAMKKVLAALCLAALTFSMTGCEDPAGMFNTVWKVLNRSSYGVGVSARDEPNWGRFYRLPGKDRRSVTVKDTSAIQYAYAPVNRVWADRSSSKNEITFRNPSAACGL